MFKIPEIFEKLKKNLSQDLLLPKYKDGKHPLSGYCYIVSEALYHILGGKIEGLTPMFIKHENINHWWIRGPKSEIWDFTANQFNKTIDYSKSVPKGFLTKTPCKRTQLLLQRSGFEV